MNKQLSTILAGTTALALWPAATYAISLSLVPSSQNISLGNRVDVAVIISDLGDGAAPSLSTYDLDINFDPAIVGFNELIFGDPVLGNQLDLFGFGTDISIDNSVPGIVSISEVSFDIPSDLDDFQADGFTLATLNFNSLDVGTSPLILSIFDLGDALGDPLTADVENSSVTVSSQPTSIPEPSFSLLGFFVISSLIGLREKTKH